VIGGYNYEFGMRENKSPATSGGFEELGLKKKKLKVSMLPRNITTLYIRNHVDVSMYVLTRMNDWLQSGLH
jgi:hypothetical protein